MLGGGDELLEALEKKLISRFKANEGSVSLVLGMQVTRDHENGPLTISREDYTKSVLESFGMSEYKPLL